MRKLTFLLLFFSNSIHSQWVTQISGTPNHLEGIDAVTATVAYAVGDFFTFLKTTNGGTNWFALPFPASDPWKCSFINVNTGLASLPGYVAKTTNGGNNWSLYNALIVPVIDVKLINNNWAYACSQSITRSTDGGVSWTLTGVNIYPYYFREMFFIDSINGTAVGGNGIIFTTTNSGINWLRRIINLPVQFGDSSLFGVHYINSSTGYICGNNGIFLKTTNSGINWTYFPTGTLTQFHAVYFMNETKGYLIGTAGRIFQTINGGVNWFQQISGVTDPLNDIDFIDENTGWICGFNGRILKTTNGGVSFIHPISDDIPDKFSLFQNYPNPFNPSTKIKFEIPNLSSNASIGDSKLETNSKTEIKIYDVLGREVAELVNEHLSPGVYEVEWDAANYPSGVYFYKLITGDFVDTKKMILVK